MKRILIAAVAAMGLSCTGASFAQNKPAEKPVINPAPTTKDWADVSKLPDWSGVWNPNITDQDKQHVTNPPPWNAKAAALIKFQEAELKAGRPTPLFVNCLPEAHPSWMMISHNALEILFTPGRVTMLGESDGNRIRRIYTDGRAHPADPDPTFHGHSIGKWDGDTLVIDTIGIVPQAYIAPSEAHGVPNQGDMHVLERIKVEKDVMHVYMKITAPHVLTKPYETTRYYFRQRARKFDIVEGVCQEGYFAPRVNKDGWHVYEPQPHDVGGNRIPPK